MKRTSEATLVERAGFLYRQLLLLQRVFPDASEDSRSLPFGDDGDARSLCYGVREVLNQLAEHARVLTSVPVPLANWRPGDTADDERWRALTEIERGGLPDETAGLFQIDRGAAHAAGPPPGAAEADTGGENDDQQELHQRSHPVDDIA